MSTTPPPVPPAPPPWTPPPPHVAGPPEKTSPLCVLALIFGGLGLVPFLGIPLGLVGILLGLVALGRRSGGRGLAVAGIVAGAVGIVFVNALVVAILLPTLGRARELARRTMCMSNLNGIAMGFALYSSENNDNWPILPDINQEEAVPYAAELKTGQKCLASSLGTGAQQNLSLLTRSSWVPYRMLLCPSTGTFEKADRGTLSEYGLGEVVGGVRKSYCDYAIQIPYLRTPEGKNRCPLVRNMHQDIVILGDRGPDGDYLNRWSPNHPEDGDSVLRSGGDVQFCKDRHDLASVRSVNAGGWGFNNIYTADKWTGTEGAPVLSAYGSTNTTPTDPLAVRDTVLYAWK